MTKTHLKNRIIENWAFQVANSSWQKLYKVGAVAALIAALAFRRNLGAAEIPLITGITPPDNVDGWFRLLHNNPLLGLTLLNVFDIVNYALVAIMFLAVYIVLKQTNKSYPLIAVILSFLGSGIYIVSNSALPMLSLSNQYAAAGTEAQKSTLLSVGQTVLASGCSSSSTYRNAGFYLSLLFVAIAGLIMSLVMLYSNVFGKATGYLGVVASVFDLVYLAGLIFVPAAGVYLLGIICMSSGGLFLMIWHLLIGFKIFKIGRKSKVNGGVNT